MKIWLIFAKLEKSMIVITTTSFTTRYFFYEGISTPEILVYNQE